MYAHCFCIVHTRVCTLLCIHNKLYYKQSTISLSFLTVPVLNKVRQVGDVFTYVCSYAYYCQCHSQIYILLHRYAPPRTHCQLSLSMFSASPSSVVGGACVSLPPWSFTAFNLPLAEVLVMSSSSDATSPFTFATLGLSLPPAS